MIGMDNWKQIIQFFHLIRKITLFFD